MTGFGNRNLPAVGGGRPFGVNRNAQRERMVFFGAAGLTFSLLIILFVVINYRAADANVSERPTATSQVQAPSSKRMVTVPVPAELIKAGTPLTGVRWLTNEMSEQFLPRGAVTEQNFFMGKYARVDLEAGKPVTSENVTSEQALVSLPLTPGNRAVAINVDETSGIEGHALPGTRVDVVLTFTQNDQLTSKIIVQNARVLSYGGDTSRGGQRPLDRAPGSRRTSTTITLDVTPKDALEIQTARQLGRVSLIMRSADDHLAPAVTEVRDTDIGGGRGQKAAPTTGARGCSKGRVKMAGKEYLVDCDGSILELDSAATP